MTTNSAAGVSTYDDFFPVFAEMEKQDMVLNLHGEVPGTSRPGITDLNAEEEFLPTLKMLNERFPKLRIVLEHCTTEAAVNAVRECSESVGGMYIPFLIWTGMFCYEGERKVWTLISILATITAHHLYLTILNREDPFAFCKPIPKKASDRDALLKAVIGGEKKFFLYVPRLAPVLLNQLTHPQRKRQRAAPAQQQTWRDHPRGSLHAALRHAVCAARAGRSRRAGPGQLGRNLAGETRGLPE